MNASPTQATNTNVAQLALVTTRFIRPGRSRGWEGLRVLPVAVAITRATDSVQSRTTLTN